MDASTLLLTVGTGQRGLPEETLIEPFGRSLRAAGCARNILLPSQQTVPQAELVRQRFAPEFPGIEIRPLPQPGDENDADACFRHFDAVFAALAADGVPGEAIIADITRGTKAMSAALLMAAALHGAGRVRYLMAVEQDDRGAAVPGAERPRDIEPDFIRLRLALQLAERHLRAFSFRAVETLLEPWLPLGAAPSTPAQRAVAPWLWAARFWGAWDRFDYRQAHRLLAAHPREADGTPPWLLPSAGQRDLLRRLAEPWPSADGERVRRGRLLSADLLANAARRLAAGHAEEALVRLYRILELITRYRLFVYNIDSECIDRNNLRVSAWLGELRRRSNSGHPLPGRTLGRWQAAQLLAFIEAQHPETRGHSIAQRLLDPEPWLGLSDAGLRNGSILIHGLEASAPQAGARLAQALEALREFFFEEHEGNRRLYEAALFPFQR